MSSGHLKVDAVNGGAISHLASISPEFVAKSKQIWVVSDIVFNNQYMYKTTYTLILFLIFLEILHKFLHFLIDMHE